jgi:hypothetical protein
VRALALGLLLALAASAPAGAITVKPAPRGGWTVATTYPPALDATIARADFRGSGRLRASDVPFSLPFAHTTVGAFPTTRGHRAALILVVNRRPIQSPSIQIADPTAVPATFRARRLGRPRTAERVAVLAGSARGDDALCRRRAPDAGALRLLADGGAALNYPPQEALVQALDAACGRPVDPAFTAAVQQEPQPAPEPSPPPNPPPPCPRCDTKSERPCPAYPCVQP